MSFFRPAENTQTFVGVTSWVCCSIGMMVFNKFAIQAFPVECTLVALQMAFTVVVMLIFTWGTIHIGSARDVLRWSMVVPFFSGMLLSSILALKYAPMTLVVVGRCMSPLLSLAIERCYPDPLRISAPMIGSIFVMVLGAAVYVSAVRKGGFGGIHWVLINIFFAVGDRLLQRLMLARDQNPVNISKTAITVINNFAGMIPLLVVMAIKNEFAEIPAAVAKLDAVGVVWVALSCIVGVLISYTGIWAQSMISATSFLVLVNANKFVIVFIEAFCLKTKALTPIQIVGACITILGGVAYGKARDWLEAEAKSSQEERQPILPKVDKP